MPKFVKKKMNVNFVCKLCKIYSIQNSPVILVSDVLCSFKFIVLIGIVILSSFRFFLKLDLRKTFVGSFLFIAVTSKMPDL